MEFTINLPESFTVKTRDDRVSVDLAIAKLPPDLITRAALHGLKQKLADAAANAKMNACVAVAGNKREGESKEAYTLRLSAAARDLAFTDIDAEALRLMEKVRDTLEKGEWGIERGEGEPGLDMVPIDFALRNMEATLIEGIPGFATLKKIDDKRRAVNAWLDAKEGRRAVVVETAKEDAARRAEEATKLAAKLKGL